MVRGSRLLAACFAVASVAAASCHLADDYDAKKCPEGSRPDNGRCLADATEPTFTISSAGGGACTVAPDSLRVAPSAQFSFDNQDGVERVITGDDGKTWGTAPAGGKSPLIGITKPGTFGFQVSGCTKGGTVVVSE